MDDLLQEMIQPVGSTGHDRARRRRLVMSAATVGLAVIGLTSLTTSALFTDNEAATASGFTTGSVDLSQSPVETILSSDNLAPGDTIWGPVTVSNTGSLGLRYAVGYYFTDGTLGTDGVRLSSQLGLTIDQVASETACNRETGPTAGTRLATVAAGDAVLADTDIIGTRSTGMTPEGSKELEIIAGGDAQVLCVGVQMALEADNAFQKTSANLAVTFNAEQTAHN